MVNGKRTIDNVCIYIITHGRPKPEQRPSSRILELSGLEFFFVMNEKQVPAYIAEGVPREQIVVSTDEFENEYFAKHKTINVDFHGAICNREMCNIHAREHGIKYAVQLDDNISDLFLGDRLVNKSDMPMFAQAYLPRMIRAMRDVCESTNIGFLGMTLGLATPTREKALLRNGYAYSFFMENVEANIPWRGPFDDDVLHNLDFNHSGTYTCALLGAFGYKKETKSKTGMRMMYDKYVHLRPAGTHNIYPDHIGVGNRPKANGTGKRFYHTFKKPLHKNIKVTNRQEFESVLNDIRSMSREWRSSKKNAKS